jgi:hypothetical protein
MEIDDIKVCSELRLLMLPLTVIMARSRRDGWGRVYTFDGTNDYINIGTQNIGTVYSFSCWMKLTGTGK